MDKIIIKGLKIFAFHGVNPEEKENGQDFILDITLFADLEEAKNTDNLDKTVNYAKVIKSVTASFTERKFDLIEAAAKWVCGRIFKDFEPVKAISITLKKPDAPVKADFEYVAVEFYEERV